MTKEQEDLLKEVLSNQKVVIGRLKSVEKQLNQIIPKPRKYSKPTDLKSYIGAKAASEYLGMSETQFYDKVRKGDIPFEYVEGQHGRRFTIKGLNEYITSRPNRR